MFHSIADSICLKKLRGIYKSTEVLRITIGSLHILGNLSISAIVSLMFLHHIRKRIQFSRIISYRLQCLNRREWLETKFRSIAEEIFAIFRKWLISMPYLPVMHISTIRIIRLIKRSAWWRACRPVKCIRIIFSEYFRNNALIHQQIVSHLCRFRYPITLFYKHFHLIIATPQCKWRMMTDSFDIINKFLTDICLKFRCQFIDRAGKHKVLPYHQAKFITKIKEPVLRIIAAAPDTNRVKVCSLTLKKQFSGTFLWGSLQQIILWNIVCTHCKNLMAIHFVSKAFSPLIFLNVHGQCPKSDFLTPGIDGFISCFQIYLNLI